MVSTYNLGFSKTGPLKVIKAFPTAFLTAPILNDWDLKVVLIFYVYFTRSTLIRGMAPIVDGYYTGIFNEIVTGDVLVAVIAAYP